MIYLQFDALMMAPREDFTLDRFPPEAYAVENIGILFHRHKFFRRRERSKVGNGEAKAKMNSLIANVFDRRLN
jgi:hypothetical protein